MAVHCCSGAVILVDRNLTRIGQPLALSDTMATDLALFGPALIDSLPTAGVDGTLDDRMRGSAAQGNCHAKTGTLTGVSALSGYCFNESGRKFVFSILMNGVSNLDAAHIGQDRIVAAIASR